MTAKFKSLILLILFSSFFSYGAQVFNFQGSFVLGSDIEYNPTFIGDSVIIINSSYVTIDLNNHIFSQLTTNTLNNINGIYIAPNLEHIIIRNGYISNVSGYGIYVSDGCSDICLDDVTINSASLGGTLLSGSLTGTGINYGIIENCEIYSCISTQTISFGLQMMITTTLLLKTVFLVIMCPI